MVIIYIEGILKNGVLLLKIHKTKNLMEASLTATQLDFERILATRQSYYNNFYLKNLEAGVVGESQVLEFLKQYGKSHWTVIQNIWLNYNGKFECDLILITKHGIYIFEIKNYNGIFLYENNDCLLNNKLLSDNAITQTKRTFRKLRSILLQLYPNLKVYAVLTFIGEHNSVEINSPVTDISIIKRDELKRYIIDIAVAEKTHYQKINPSKIIAQLEKYETTNYFVPSPLKESSMHSLRKGIYCANCKSFNVDIRKLYIHCPCGYTEKREIGVLRTICEYAVLTMAGRITQSEALNFMNGQASGKYLTNILKKYFKQHYKSRYTYYKINPLPLHKMNLLSNSKI